jgi:hypothetical protein
LIAFNANQVLIVIVVGIRRVMFGVDAGLRIPEAFVLLCVIRRHYMAGLDH